MTPEDWKLGEKFFVLYGDCGTGGLLDAVLEEEGVPRIPGPHCYQFYAGIADFTRLTDAEPGCFFLTDYLARHFERLIIEGLGLDRHPELRDDYFGNYTKLVYLAQREDAGLRTAARAAAARLGLAYEYRLTGYGEMAGFLAAALFCAFVAGPALAESAELVFPTDRAKGGTPDPDDEMILECALAAEADCIVTGDKRHLQGLKECRGIRIVSPAEFLRLLAND
jgi:hypothetical protein